MPYIKQSDRNKVAEMGSASTPGELNYMICRLVDSYVETIGHDYATYNAVIGALECAKLEIYRRLVVNLEELKCATNGDVFTMYTEASHV